MKIQEIYKKIKIPNNLQMHMLMVAATVSFIRDNWKGNDIEWNKIIKAALLHDMGNIVKFDMDKFPDLMGKEINKIDYWKKTQKEVIRKYGADDHEATEKILKELGVDRDIIKIILKKSFGNSKMTAFQENWETKILLYCDVRTSPTGIVTLDERIVDIKRRMPKYANDPDFPEIVKAVRILENQIQKNLKVSIDDINNNIKKYKKDLLEMEI